MGRFWAAVFFLLIVVTIIPGHGSCLEENDPDQILYINSYDFDFSWSKLMADGVHDGIISGLNESEKPGVYVLTEFMDSKFISDDTHFRNLYNLYSYKLRDNRPGVIIVSDDNALRFMREYGDEMFPGVPVVFTGINDYDSILDDLPTNYTGIIEKIPIEENIDLVLRLHPDLNTIYFVIDDTFTGKTIRRQTENITKKYENRIEIRYSGQELSTGEILREVQELPDNSAVIFFTYSALNEKGDKMYPDRYIMTLMNQDRIPVYTVMDQYNDLGVSGGYQESAYELGKMASLMAMEIIKGTDPNDIPVVTDIPSKIELNYDDIKKYDI
ncbi:ABC transporter substrate-binding protein [Methanolacinia petrolearia]|uniref:ABC transporter substrate-binding protein n=1 Tax=Methanolacinia petrolearia TaxID=54120 RepID=UPI003BA847EB